MELQNIILREISQTQEDNYHILIFSLIYGNFFKSQPKSKRMITRDLKECWNGEGRQNKHSERMGGNKCTLHECIGILQ
jgi:hypothetical protein